MLGGISPNIPNLDVSLGGIDDAPNIGQIAPGITATGTDPLPYIPAPSLGLPSQVDVAITGPAVPTVTGSGGFALNKLSVGRARLDLDDGYWLSLNEYQSEVFIENSTTQMETRIWGAGQVAVNGTDAGQFWGTTSFELANGAKITIETAENLALNSYFLDKLTVTKEDRAVIITGVSSETLGDLTLQQSNDGYRVDDAVRDGYVLVEDVSTAPPPVAIDDPVQLLSPELSVETAAATETPEAVMSSGSPEAAVVCEAPATAAATETQEPVAVSAVPDAGVVPNSDHLTVASEGQTSVGADTFASSLSESAMAEATDNTAPAAPMITAVVSEEPMVTALPIAIEAPTVAAAPTLTEAPTVAAAPKIIGGWVSEWGDPFTRQTLQQETGIGAAYGPNSQLMSLGEVNGFVATYVVFGHITSLWSLYEMNNSTYATQDIYRERSQQRLPELELWLMNNPNAQATRA